MHESRCYLLGMFRYFGKEAVTEAAKIPITFALKQWNGTNPISRDLSLYFKSSGDLENAKKDILAFQGDFERQVL